MGQILVCILQKLKCKCLLSYRIIEVIANSNKDTAMLVYTDMAMDMGAQS